MNILLQGIVGEWEGVGGLIWAITDSGSARGHVQISSHISKRGQSDKKNTNTSVLHLPLQVKWNDLMCSAVGVGNVVGGKWSVFVCGWLVGVWVARDHLLCRCASCIDSVLLSSPPCRAKAHTFTKSAPHFFSLCTAVELVLTLLFAVALWQDLWGTDGARC